MTMKNSEDLLKFAQYSSCVDASFWHKLAQLKLDVDRLNEPLHNVWGYFSNVKPRGLNRILSVDCSSFNKVPDAASLILVGIIQNKNTLDGFRETDKNEFLQSEGKKIMEVIKEEGLENTQSIGRFALLTFADLKKHKFTYWFSFPAINVVTARLEMSPYFAEEVFTQEQLDDLRDVDRTWNYFVLKIVETGAQVYTVKEGFSKWKDEPGNWFLAFADICDDESYPGWPLRNFLALFAYHCPDLLKAPVQVLCFRLRVENGIWSAGKSLVLSLNLSVKPDSWVKPDVCVGWEKNEKGKFGPRLADLHSSMDPLCLAESSVDLNLKLMKWQIMPDLDLNIVQKTRCLLLGAGTLGCAVARCLLAWGVRNITFLDNAAVSYSNPVRQNLYQFSDVGKSKAHAAAAALKAIFPPVISKGVEMSIPMPGHPVGESLLEESKRAVSDLDQLIREHDAIFLLMDSRESRWLPTVIGAVHEKIVVNAALGFDTYLVMRHGLKTKELNPSEDAKSIHGSKLGCYFCSDVTAPGNSGQARTLDQQCTVTRPGVSNIAGSLAVELLVSILQHKEGGLAPAYTVPLNDTDCILGLIPHSIRGFLSRFQTILPAIEAFSSCVACSENVLKEYREKGFDFVFQVLQSKDYLEEITGLSSLHKESLMTELLEISSDSSDCSDD